MLKATDKSGVSEAHPIQRATKRVVDIVIAVAALILFSPLIVLEAIIILCAMGRPVLFRQLRPGMNEQLFEVVKFRTMLPAQNKLGRPMSEADRVTRLGWILRRTSLDEMPQLWSVIKGDLSLVGPRPLLREYLPFFSERERIRHSVPPGVTGLAQISGRNRLTWDERLELDVQYVEQWSFWFDIKIILKTFGCVFKSEGVNRDPDQEGALNVLRGTKRAAIKQRHPTGSPSSLPAVEVSSVAVPQPVKAPGLR
jgi:lipopolysaccharide/colanic/teichoic acid biosynthesis glycosyltransferase